MERERSEKLRKRVQVLEEELKCVQDHLGIRHDKTSQSCDITLMRVKLGTYITLNPNMERSKNIAMYLIICQVFVLVF